MCEFGAYQDISTREIYFFWIHSVELGYNAIAYVERVQDGFST